MTYRHYIKNLSKCIVTNILIPRSRHFHGSSQVVYALLDEDGDQNLSTKEFNPVKKIQKMIDLKIVIIQNCTKILMKESRILKCE